MPLGVGYGGLFVMAGQAKLPALEVHDQIMADRSRCTDGPMDIVTGSAFDSLLGSLEHSGQRRSRTHGRSGNEVRIRKLGRRVAHTNGMHVGQVCAAAKCLYRETWSVGADAAVPVERRLAIALIDGDGAIMATQTSDR